MATLSHAPNQPQMNNVHCPRCGAECYNTWGLVEHLKTCNGRNPEIEVSLTWVVADDADAAHSMGKEDATEGRKRDTTLYTSMNAAYNAYNVGFNEGVRLCMELGEAVSSAVLNECAWFDEICGAEPVVTITDADVTALFAGDYSNVECAEYRADWIGA